MVQKQESEKKLKKLKFIEENKADFETILMDGIHNVTSEDVAAKIKIQFKYSPKYGNMSILASFIRLFVRTYPRTAAELAGAANRGIINKKHDVTAWNNSSTSRVVVARRVYKEDTDKDTRIKMVMGFINGDPHARLAR